MAKIEGGPHSFFLLTPPLNAFLIRFGPLQILFSVFSIHFYKQSANKDCWCPLLWNCGCLTAVAGRFLFLRADLGFEKSYSALEGRFGFFKKGCGLKLQFWRYAGHQYLYMAHIWSFTWLLTWYVLVYSSKTTLKVLLLKISQLKSVALCA